MSIETLSEYTLEQWQVVASREIANAETRLFIDGAYVDAASGGRFDTINPADREIIASMSFADEKDVDTAVKAARNAFRSGSWSRMAPRDRMAVLYRYASLIEEKAEQLAVLDTLDMGKPISDMVGVDIPAVVETIQFMAEYIDKMEGSVTNTESEVMHFVLREPIGVVAAISPWNYPLLMAIWKVVPALAAGNCVVLKPAEQAPLSCLKLAELFVEAGVIWVNCFDEGDMTQPFGGYKQSGHARDKCIESLLSYTQSKSAWLRLSA